jgi:endonuclease/exonuclease/phosphatase family metal-dependent hydrolase
MGGQGRGTNALRHEVLAMSAAFRVLSYNIHKGFAPARRRFVLKHMKESIQLVQADLVFLQEVLGHHERRDDRMKDWKTASQFEYVADTVWPHYTYGKNAVYTSGHHGNAILSKYPFTLWENIDISSNRFDRRGILHGVVSIPNREHPLHVICIHLGLLEIWRKNQIDRLCQQIEANVPAEAPLIVAGDFNDWRERITHELSQRLQLQEAFWKLYGEHARTFPSWFPILKLDRIYCRGLSVVAAQCLTEGHWSHLSDHTALSAEFMY